MMLNISKLKLKRFRLNCNLLSIALYAGIEAVLVSSRKAFPKKLSVKENLIVYGHLYGVKKVKSRIEYLTEKLRLNNICGVKKSLSYVVKIQIFFFIKY